MDYEPPFLESYKTLLQGSVGGVVDADDISETRRNDKSSSIMERFEIPLIDLSRLNLDHSEKEECMKEITEAATKWGLFQVVNHGVSQEVLQRLLYEQMKVFRRPFASKCEEDFLNLPARSYRWGNPSATNLRQLTWSEALHMFLPDIARMDQNKSMRYVAY